MFTLYPYDVPEWAFRYPHTWPGQVKQKFKSGHGKARKIAARARIAKRKAKR